MRPKSSLKISLKLSKSNVQNSLKVYAELLWLTWKNYSQKSTSISKTPSFTIVSNFTSQGMKKVRKNSNQSFTSSNPPLAYLVDARLLLSCPKKKTLNPHLLTHTGPSPLPFARFHRSSLTPFFSKNKNKKSTHCSIHPNSTPIRVGFDLRRPQRARGSACPTSRLVRDRLPDANHSVPSLHVSFLRTITSPDGNIVLFSFSPLASAPCSLP